MNDNRIAEQSHSCPLVHANQPIMFETAHSWNPGRGNDPASNGNGGINLPSSNPNGIPDGTGLPGNGSSNGKAKGKGKNT
jgi:hypothetical protein